ncbi:MAG: bifunctional diaminohydroxyphosphoribosylaminopyrimidine deaminase/5-amino-6-(5-phosphoribosylamino)uracil reductase RibD [Gammaproteobacteria bacterium]
MTFDANDHAHMSRALQLAARGLYTTDPNPRVGCVIVAGGVVVGEGFHARAGEPHAEVHALRAAGDRTRGATVYVTLEPCSHHGRTGPCADALIAAEPARVVVAMQDPNPQVSGEGIRKLRAAGIAVDVGLLESEARALNPGFVSRMTRGRPYVRVKLAMSLDGRTAMASGESRWITGPEAREDVQRLRARSGAVLTGTGTLLADDPALTVRAGDWKFGRYEAHGELPVRQPLRVLLDRELRGSPSAQLFAGAPAAAPVLVCASAAALAQSPGRERAAALGAGPGVEVIGLPPAAGGLDLHALLASLAGRGVNELLVEAGAGLAGAFVAGGLADELVVYLAPALLGSSARPLLELPIATMAGKVAVVFREVRPVGADIRMIARFDTAL